MNVDRPTRLSGRRRSLQLILWAIVPLTIFGGLRYPLVGFIVPSVMLTGIIGAYIKKGRYVCGFLCPRGAFFDRVIVHISPNKRIPDALRAPAFRWSVLALLMGFMAFQIAQDPSSAQHWGRVFVRICIITTAVGIVLAFFVHKRAWCSFCPMGTLQGQFSRPKDRLKMGADCKECRTCEKSCPMNLRIVDNTDTNGALLSKDCLLCPECQKACPKKILSLP